MKKYVVQPNDTIYSIAQMYNILPSDIIKTNNLSPTYILIPGNTLIIPDEEQSALDVYVVQKGDTLDSIAKQFYTSSSILAQLNGLEENEYIYPGEKIFVPKKGVILYITKPGDTLNLVVEQNKIKPEDLFIFNKRLYLLPEQLIAFKPQNIDKLEENS